MPSDRPLSSLKTYRVTVRHTKVETYLIPATSKKDARERAMAGEDEDETGRTTVVSVEEDR